MDPVGEVALSAEEAVVIVAAAVGTAAVTEVRAARATVVVASVVRTIDRLSAAKAFPTEIAHESKARWWPM